MRKGYKQSPVAYNPYSQDPQFGGMPINQGNQQAMGYQAYPQFNPGIQQQLKMPNQQMNIQQSPQFNQYQAQIPMPMQMNQYQMNPAQALQRPPRNLAMNQNQPLIPQNQQSQWYPQPQMGQTSPIRSTGNYMPGSAINRPKGNLHQPLPQQQQYVQQSPMYPLQNQNQMPMGYPVQQQFMPQGNPQPQRPLPQLQFQKQQQMQMQQQQLQQQQMMQQQMMQQQQQMLQSDGLNSHLPLAPSSTFQQSLLQNQQKIKSGIPLNSPHLTSAPLPMIQKGNQNGYDYNTSWEQNQSPESYQPSVSKHQKNIMDDNDSVSTHSRSSHSRPNSGRSNRKSGTRTPVDKRTAISTMDRYRRNSKTNIHPSDFESYNIQDYRDIKIRDGMMKLPAGLGQPVETDKFREKKEKMERMKQYALETRARMRN